MAHCPGSMHRDWRDRVIPDPGDPTWDTALPGSGEHAAGASPAASLRQTQRVYGIEATDRLLLRGRNTSDATVRSGNADP